MSLQFFITILVLGLSYNLTNAAALPGKNSRQQISGNDSCNGSISNIFSKIPEFISSSCNISAIPNTYHANILLEYNEFTPVLCMGVTESASRICQIGINSSVSDSFLTFLDKFNLTNKINNSDYNYSLKNFCGGLVSKFLTTNKKEENSVLTILKSEFNVEEKCNLMCRHTNDSSAVNPLCSFIVWSDSIEANQSTLPKTGKTPNEENMPEENGEAKHSSTAALALGTDKSKMLSSTPATDPVDKVNEESGNLVKDSESKNKPPVDPTMDSGSEKKQEDSTIGSGSNDKQVEPSNGLPGSNSDKAVSVSPGAPSKGSPQSNDDGKADNKLKSEAGPNTISKTDADSTVKETSSTSKLTGGELTTSKTKMINLDEDQPFTEFTESNGQKPNDFEVQSLDQEQDVKLNENEQEKNEENEGGTGLNQDGIDTEPESFNGNGVEKPLSGIGIEMDEEKNKKTAEESNKKNKPEPKEYTDNDYKNNGASGQNQVILKDPFIDTEDTPFFSYFLFMSVLTIVVYLVFHNKNKLVALAVEGRRKKGSRRRPNSSLYSKLHCSLEEAMASKTSSASVTQVLY